MLSSLLILSAERELAARHDCGPDGMLTYVAHKKIRSTNPGFCFLKAGWKRIGWSKDKKKVLLWKPFELAGIAP